MVSFMDRLFFPERKSLHQRLCTEITTKLNKNVAILLVLPHGMHPTYSFKKVLSSEQYVLWLLLTESKKKTRKKTKKKQVLTNRFNF